MNINNINNNVNNIVNININNVFNNNMDDDIIIIRKRGAPGRALPGAVPAYTHKGNPPRAMRY